MCGTPFDFNSAVSVGQTSSNFSVNVTLSSVQGTQYFYGLFVSSNGARYHTGPVTITATPAQPTIIVNPPSGGTFQIGCSLPITWNSQNAGNNVSIELQRQSDGQLISLANPTSNDGNFTHPVVGQNGAGNFVSGFGNNYYRVKIYPTGTSGYAGYSPYFYVPNPGFSFSSPNSQATFASGALLSVQWTSSNLCGTISLELTDPSGNYLRTIADNTANTGSRSWNLPTDLPAGLYRVKIYPTNTTGLGVLSDAFTVNAAAPALSMASNVSFGTTTLQTGTVYNATFSVRNNGNAAWSGSMYVQIDGLTPSLNAGSATINPGATQNYTASYTPASSNIGNNKAVEVRYVTSGQGSSVRVPNQTTTYINIGQATSPITIGTLPTSLNWNCAHNITWTSATGTGNVSIELRRAANDEFVGYIADGIANTNSFNWTVGKDKNGNHMATITGGSYKLKMYPTGTTGLPSYSNASFTIPNPTLTVSQPIAATYQSGQTLPITWSGSQFCSPVVTIEYTNASGQNPQYIVQNVANNGSFNWPVSSTLAAGQYRVKVYIPTMGGTASPASGTSAAFTVGGTAAPCPNCMTGTYATAASFSTQEHYCAAQHLCSLGIINANQALNPKSTIRRDDLAKMVYLGLLGTSATTAQNFDVPFVDVPRNAEYAPYVKTLSYLDYADGQPPFNRDRTIFYPANPILRQDVVKVLLETWNIDESTASGSSPFSDVSNTSNNAYYFRYIKKAHELTVVTGPGGGLFSPIANCTREDAFLMLSRMLTKPGIPKPNLTQIEDGLFRPNNLRSDNMGLGVGTDRGNFNHYTKTSFAIDGTVPLVFAHSYNSYATELPGEMFPGFMGAGWTHSFNCYVVTNFTDTTDPTARRRIVHYPDGTLHYYVQNSNGSWSPETIGLFDIMTEGVSFLEITTPGKIIYRFETQAGKAGNYLLIRSIKDRNNNTLTFTNELGTDSYPRLRAVADPQGRTLNFSYTGDNYLVSVSLGGVNAFNGRNIQFTYNIPPIDGGPDRLPDLTSYTEPAAQGGTKTTVYSYTTGEGNRHLLTTIKLPKGNEIRNTYFQRKLRSSETLNGTATVQKMTVNWTPNYMANNVTSTGQVSVQDGSDLTKTTTIGHNTDGLPINVQTNGSNPLNMSLTYAATGDKTAVTNVTQNGTGVGIDYYTTPPYNPQRVRTQGPDGIIITQTYAYNSFNDISSFTNGRGFTTTFIYNATGNLTQVNYPAGSPTVIGRNTNGTVSSMTTPVGVVTTFGYNNYGNLTSSNTANGSTPITSSATYDELSRLKTAIDARGNTTSYDYFANDLLQKLTAPLGYNVTYGYDANDNSTSVTNAKGNATTMQYNQQTDQLMSRSFARQTESFTYFDDGSLKTFTNKRGNTFTFVYDASGRVQSDSYANYNYNADGTLNTLTNSTGSRTYTLDYDYDILKRVSQTTCGGFAVQYGYDENNNRTRLTYPDSKTLTYTYDAKDRLTQIRDWAGRTTLFTFDDDGKLQLTTLHTGARVRYFYDVAGRPTGLRHEKSDLTAICSYSYALDQGGNHTGETILEPYAPTPALTPGTTNYTTDVANRTTQAGSRTFGFDGNGAVSNQNGQPLTWDIRDNLLTGYGTSFFYDGNETRRAKTARRYVLDELTNSVIAETDDAGTYLYYYVHGPTGLLYRQNAGTGAVEYYHYDFRGSTVATTDQNQIIIRKYQYDAYGNILQQTPAANTDDNPFRYVGQHGVQYEQPNLYFMRARYYDPTIGKFLSEDPIWNTNLYAYAEGNPVMMVDPGGKAGKFLNGTKTFVIENVTDLENIKGWVEQGIDILSKNYGDKMDALASKLYNIGGDKLVALIKNLAEARYLGTGHVEEAMNSYYDKYEKSVVNGKPDNLALTGYLITSLWTPDSWIHTANAFTVGADYTGKGLTSLIGRTGWLGLVDMRTKAGLALKLIYGVYNVGVMINDVHNTYLK